MWIYDLETLRFLEVNEAAVKHYGYSRAEFLRMRLSDIHPKEDVARLKVHVQAKRPRLTKLGRMAASQERRHDHLRRHHFPQADLQRAQSRFDRCQ